MQDGCTPLYAVAQNGHTEVVEMLIKSGAAVNATSEVRKSFKP